MPPSVTALILILTFPSISRAERDILFAKRVGAFFSTHCLECHSADAAEGELTLEGISQFPDTSVEVWTNVTKRLALGEMPPPDAKQPAHSERSQMLGLLTSRLRAADASPSWQHQLLYPEYGNLIDHSALFDGSAKAAAFTPARIWKKSPYIHDSLVLRGIGLGKGRYARPNSHLAKVKQPFTIEDKAGVKDFAAVVVADSATLATMLRNAETVVDKHLGEAMYELDVRRDGPPSDDDLPKDKNGKPIRPRFPKTAPEFAAVVLNESTPSDEQLRDAIGKMFQLVIERDPTSTEVEKYRTLARECIAVGGNAEGLRATLIAVSVSPPAVYRMELGQGPADDHGRQMLSSAELAFAISYALTDEKPDEKLLEAARSGRLRSREDVHREVTRIWDDQEIEKPRILRFFHEFFGYHRAPQVFKDDARFGKSYDRAGVAEQLVADADALVLYHIQRDQNVLAELLTTDEFFVAHTGDNEASLKTGKAIEEFYAYLKDKDWKAWPYQTPKKVGEHLRTIDRMFAHPNGNVVKGWMKYLTKCDSNGVAPIPRLNKREFIEAWNLDEKTFDYPYEQPFQLPQGRRAGILMHPAWLIAHSLNLDNDPIRRGKWIRERLLADSVPELPITVDASIPDEPDQPLRHRFRVTRQDECWRCHEQMNPLGMPFEQFDDFGRFRKVERLHAKDKTVDVNAKGELVGTRSVDLDGPVDNPFQLVERLAVSDRVRQSFVRHGFRYWMGRNEMLSDSTTLRDADQEYRNNGDSFRALVLSLLTSDSFLYRKPLEHSDE